MCLPVHGNHYFLPVVCQTREQALGFGRAGADCQGHQGQCHRGDGAVGLALRDVLSSLHDYLLIVERHAGFRLCAVQCCVGSQSLRFNVFICVPCIRKRFR